MYYGNVRIVLCVRTTAGQVTEEQAADEIETAENASLSQRITYVVEVNLSESNPGSNSG